MRVLLVTHQILVGMAAQHELEEVDHEVLGPAITTEEGLAIAATTHPDLAFVDIDLDRENADDFARLLLDRWGARTLFAIEGGAYAAAYRSIAIGFLYKPYSSAALVNSVAVVDALLHDEPLPRSPNELELCRISVGT